LLADPKATDYEYADHGHLKRTAKYAAAARSLRQFGPLIGQCQRQRIADEDMNIRALGDVKVHCQNPEKYRCAKGSTSACEWAL
jgi:hypothetical protein